MAVRTGEKIPLGYQTGVYDSALMGILQDCVKLPQFLDAVFSFLSRRTDFYVIMEHERAKMGFPPGVAENMVLQAFRKYEVLTRKRETELLQQKESKRLESLDDGGSKNDPEPEPEPEVHIQDELPVTLPDQAGPPSSSKKRPEDKGGSKKERKDAPVLSKEEVEDWEKVSDVFNGAAMKNYKWSQTINDIDVRVPIQDGTKAKDIKVDIRSDHLKVEFLRPTAKVLIDKPFLHKIKVEESMWSIDKDRGLLTINLEKTKEIMWKSVLEGEEAIDLTKVDTTRDISEFDPECQAAIQKVTYDEHMKRLGKPTSGQTKAHDMLKKAWNAEGSPFKGTPFDPSRVQISGDFK